jgi:hypothetical protein
MGAFLSRRSCGAHLSRWKMLIKLPSYVDKILVIRLTRKVVDGEPCHEWKCELNVNKAVRVGRLRD